MKSPTVPEVLPAWDPSVAEETPEAWEQRFGMVEWVGFWDDDEEGREFLVPGLVPEGLAVSMFSGPGVGKSLLALEWAVCLSEGLDMLGEPTRPRTVLYVDHENDRVLLRERLEAMGLEGLNLERLHYSLLGDWEPLDTPRGGSVLVRMAKHLGADLVVIDTTAMVIAGEENSADTFNRLAQYAVQPLKAAGIASLRLDHTGKDAERGERGSSSKRGGVDLAYYLHPGALPGVVILRREKNRPHLTSPDTVALRRTTDPLALRHVRDVPALGNEAKVQSLVNALDAAGLQDWASQKECREALKAAGLKAANDDLSAARNRRQARG